MSHQEQSQAMEDRPSDVEAGANSRKREDLYGYDGDNDYELPNGHDYAMEYRYNWYSEVDTLTA